MWETYALRGWWLKIVSIKASFYSQCHYIIIMSELNIYISVPPKMIKLLKLSPLKPGEKFPIINPSQPRTCTSPTLLKIGKLQSIAAIAHVPELLFLGPLFKHSVTAAAIRRVMNGPESPLYIYRLCGWWHAWNRSPSTGSRTPFSNQDIPAKQSRVVSRST